MKTDNFEAERRRREIDTYGKLLSLRPSKVHKSKKEYKRTKVNLNSLDLY